MTEISITNTKKHRNEKAVSEENREIRNFVWDHNGKTKIFQY